MLYHEQNGVQMKICIIVTGLPPDFTGGTEIQTYNIASKIAKKHNVTVLTRSVKGKPKECIENGFKVKRFSFINFPVLRFFSHILFAFNEVRKMRKDIDVCYCMMMSPNGLVGSLSNIFFKTKTIASIRGTDWYMTGFAKNMLNKFVVHHSDMIVAQTEKTRKEIVDKYPDAKTCVVHNGVDIDGTISGGKNIVYVGTLRRVKGVEYLIKAMDDIDSELVIIGDGPLKEELKTLAQGKRIRFTGKLGKKEVRKEMKDARVLVLPSLSEGLPNVVLEAMSMGLPVVATNVSGIPEIVNDGETGFLVEPRNSKSIVLSVNKILKNKQLWKKMSVKSLIDVKKYSWPNTISSMEKLLKGVCGDKI